MATKGFFNRFIKSSEDRKILNTVEKRGGLEVILEAWRSNEASEECSVTPNSSLQVAAVWACVRLISETISSLPLFIYEDKDGEKKRAKDHYLYPILHYDFNPIMTALEGLETMQSHLDLWGNAYAFLFYDAQGRVTEIWPMRPDRMLEVKIDNGRKFFHYQWENGKVEWLTDNEVWHIPGLGNGIVGFSPIGLMRRSIGLAKDAEKFGAKFFANDARPGIVIEHPATLSDAAYKNLKDSITDEHEGVDKSHKAMILEEGMKLHEVGIPPEDAQFLQTRQFQVKEVARIFHIQPHLIADLDQSTNNNIEHQGIEFVVYSARPRLVRWEKSIHKHLLLPRERGRFYAEFLVDGLLRGDTLSRYQAYGVGKQWGWLSTNDIRRMENMNGVKGGDVIMAPLNMVPLEDFGKTQPSKDKSQTGKRMAAAAKILLDDVLARAIKREAQDLKNLAKKHLADGTVDHFEDQLRGFYDEHIEWVKKQVLPVVRGLLIMSEDHIGDAELVCDQFCELYRTRGEDHIKQAMAKAANGGTDLRKAVEDASDSFTLTRVSITMNDECDQVIIS